MTARTTLQLGIQPDGTALVALWVAPYVEERWFAKLGPLPATATARPGTAARVQVFSVPPGCIREDWRTLVTAEDCAVIVHHCGEVTDLDGGEAAPLPVRWLSWVITPSVILDYFPSRADMLEERALKRLARWVTE